jgi:hypothetical protein
MLSRFTILLAVVAVLAQTTFAAACPTTCTTTTNVAGRSRDWLKFKHPAAPAVRREFEEDWGRTRQ